MSFSNTQELGKPVEILDEGISLATNIESINFTGAGVTGSVIGDDITEDVPGGIGNDQVVENLSAQCDGANKEFTLSNNYISGSIALDSTQFPQVYLPVTDFTETAVNKITLTAAVDAPQAGQSLRVVYAKA